VGNCPLPHLSGCKRSCYLSMLCCRQHVGHFSTLNNKQSTCRLVEMSEMNCSTELNAEEMNWWVNTEEDTVNSLADGQHLDQLGHSAVVHLSKQVSVSHSHLFDKNFNHLHTLHTESDRLHTANKNMTYHKGQNSDWLPVQRSNGWSKFGQVLICHSRGPL